MAPVTQNTSSIAMALAGMTASVDIPRPRDGSFWTGRDSFATVAARSLPTKKQSGMLPTPPNSISPSLPPQAFDNNKGHTSAAPPTPPAGPTHVDSDIDLQDAVDHAKAQDQPQHGGLSLNHHPNNLAGLDTAGAITPNILAKHHLPHILLTHGPLAIRHIMGHLTTSVPGFSGIPPAKARRLVVGALEGRGSGGEGAGINADVDFEKVGWGRWDAKQRGGHPTRSSTHHSHPPPARQQHSPPPNTPAYAPHGLRIPTRRHDRPRPAARTPSLSLDSEPDSFAPRSHSDAENEADKMSLDEAESSCSSSECPDADEALPDADEPGDVTDEEDWASIGAAALRQASVASGGKSAAGCWPPQGLGVGGGGRMAQLAARRYSRQAGGGGGGPAREALAKSMPGFEWQAPSPQQVQHLSPSHAQSQLWSGFPDLMQGVGSDSQERDAIEALVRLSSI